MLPKEQPSMPPGGEKFAGIMSSLEDELSKDKLSVKKMWHATGDLVRDVDTASKMAKEKFEGDTALMHIARGAVTTGVGVGLEKAMEYMWDKVWQGDIPFYDKQKFGEGMAEAMNDFAAKGRLQARLIHAVKEGTQDLSTAVFYNFLAFRGQPLLPKAGAEHLVRSLGVDLVEAMVAPGIPEEVADKSHALQAKIADAKIRQLKLDIGTDLRSSFKYSQSNEGGKGYDIKTTFEFQDDIDANRIALESARNEKLMHEFFAPLYNPSKTEKVLRGIINVSNPVTQLGGEWIVQGIKELKHNFDEVRKVRREKGGMEGKKVFMPKKEEPWKHDTRRPYGDKKPWEKREYNNKDKVYYGKSKWEEKRLEEDELKGD